MNHKQRSTFHHGLEQILKIDEATEVMAGQQKVSRLTPVMGITVNGMAKFLLAIPLFHYSQCRARISENSLMHFDHRLSFHIRQRNP